MSDATRWRLDTTMGLCVELVVERLDVRGRGAATRGGYVASAPRVSPDARSHGDDAERAVARLVGVLAVDHDIFVERIVRPKQE